MSGTKKTPQEANAEIETYIAKTVANNNTLYETSWVLPSTLEKEFEQITEVSVLLNQMDLYGDKDGSIARAIGEIESTNKGITNKSVEAWYANKANEEKANEEKTDLNEDIKKLANAVSADLTAHAADLLLIEAGLEAEVEGDLAKIRAQMAAAALADSEKQLEADDSSVSGATPAQAGSAEERLSITKKTYQCFLSHNIEQIADFHRTQFAKDLSTNKQAFELPNGDRRIILVDDANPKSSYFASNKMTCLGKTNGFNDIKSSELAQLLPELRIYKIIRSEGKEISKVELEFDAATDAGFLTAPRSGGFAKGSGAGVRSFNWSFIGGNPFTATRDLTATLKIYFQDFQDLTKKRTGVDLYDPKRAEIKYRYVDLVLQPDCREPVIETPEEIGKKVETKRLGYDIYRPECYEVAIDVGYAPVKGSKTMRSSIAKMINNQKDTLYLTAKEHTFNIGQDGTFELTINYAARLATTLGDKGMNVLVPGGGHAVSTDTEVAGSKLLWNLEKVDDLIVDARKEAGDGDESNKLKKLEALREIIISKSNSSFNSGIMFSLINRNMIYKINMSNEEYNKFSKYSQFDRTEKKLIGIDDQSFYVDPSVASEGADPSITSYTALKQTAAQDDRLVYLPQGNHKIYFTTLGNIIAIVTEHVMAENSIIPGGSLKGDANIETWLAGIDNNTEDPLSEEELNEELNEGFEDRAGMEDDENTGARANKDVTAILEPESAKNKTVNLNPARLALMDKFRIILGTISYKGIVDGKEHAINIMHLPVSMEMFTGFMIDRVTSTNRTFYSYQSFIRDLLTDIVLKSLSRECFGGYFEESVKAGIGLFKGQGVKNKEPITNHPDPSIYGQTSHTKSIPPPEPMTDEEEYPQSDPESYEEEYPQSDPDGPIPAPVLPQSPSGPEPLTYKVLKLANATQARNVFVPGTSNSAKNYDYLMFSAFSIAGFAKKLGGCIDDDADLGIPHFRFGQKTGFLKSASFNKTPIEFQAEARYLSEGSDNMLNMLAGRYEVQMSLVGNGLFVPGQYIFFNSIGMGAGHPSDYINDDARSIANIMGLGGYHIITEVGCTIAPGTFETTIKALWDTGGTSIECIKGKK